MSNFLVNNVKSFILKLEDYDSTKKFFLYSVFARKIFWKHNDIKQAGLDILGNLNRVYLPSLKLSKSQQLKKLFEKIDITIPDTGFIFSIDEYKILNSRGKVADNISVDYSRILNNSLNDLFLKYEGDDEYSNSQKELIEAIIILIDREIHEITLSNREDKEKYVKFLENIKYSTVSTFEEALQRILFFNQIFWQSGHQLNGFGRLDKVLDSIYKKDSISQNDALNLIKDFLRCGHDYFYFKSTALPGDTGQIIVLGGKELDGQYFSNDLTYLFIKAVQELQLPDPKLILRYSEDVPRDLMELSVNCMSTGVGSPLMSNDDRVIDYLVDFGYDRKDAYNYVVSACWEPAPIGKGFEMNNIESLVFLEPLDSLLDNENLNFNDFDSLLNKYEEYLDIYCSEMIDEINEIKWERNPILSLFIDDCDLNHKDLSEGGAKYNNFGLTTVSLSNTVNSLLNIKHLVFDENKFTLDELNEHRLNNFENEDVLNILKNQSLKFGVDNEEVINLTNRITSSLNDVFKNKKNIYGGNFKFGLSSPSYISLAPDIKASFDGRKNGEAFNVHISFDDNKDYTELMRFASKLNYSDSRFNGNVVDFMVSPDFIQNNFDKFTDFLDISLKMGVFQLQLNVVSSDTLIKAKANPDQYPNLIVRVWGFSAYFKDLPESYQDLLIKRAIENECKNN